MTDDQRARLEQYAQHDDAGGWSNVAPSDVRALLADHASLTARVERLRSYLEIYADSANWERTTDGAQTVWVGGDTGPDTALEALGG